MVIRGGLLDGSWPGNRADVAIMFGTLANIVTRRWQAVLAIWACVVVGLYLASPRWNTVTHDGDFAYLPRSAPSAIGEQWMEAAFPHERGKSQVVIAIAREGEPLTNDDIHVAYDVARRMKNLCGAARLHEALRQSPPRGSETDAASDSQRARLLAAARDAELALEDAIELDDELADYWVDRCEVEPAAAPYKPPRLAHAHHNLALVRELLGDEESAREHRRVAVQLDPVLSSAGRHPLPEIADRMPLVDVWTWRDDYFGETLTSRDRAVRLVVLQLSNEFMATANIGIVEGIEAELSPVREHWPYRTKPGLAIVRAGSAAVGADLLRSAADGIRNTELFSIVLVVIILVLVYRSPLLVLVPVVTILAAFVTATSVVALLTQLSVLPGFGWWTLKVFSTTRIFIVVILFGAGTDYCLFLISRYKEELASGRPHGEAASVALTRVGDALAASAFTTILGLGMLFFAEFGKFRYSGPVIALCLAITLLACVTLTPAIMRGLGPMLFWPWGVGRRETAERQGSGGAGSPRRRQATSLPFWHWLARGVVTRPGTTLIFAVAIMLPAAGYGLWRGTVVSYDFFSNLPADSPSRAGVEALKRHFPIGERGSLTVLVHRGAAAFEGAEGRDQIRQLSDRLQVQGVRAVRSAEDPLGDFERGERPGVASERARRARILRAHPRTKAVFVAQTPELSGNVARFELILECDPFSFEALAVVNRVETSLRDLFAAPHSFWHGARFAVAGTTAAIRDLRDVTRRDYVRIQTLVVLSVFVVLLVILRRPVICAFMMLSVVFSYYVAIGVTALLFSWRYGYAYEGLDWKVPLFLFVILVAIGQDYNVYLATRVLEEQARIGPFAGLRRALVRTGGIITSCGVIMAGTFIAMTSGTWRAFLPDSLFREAASGPQRGIVELGFALALGVLLDTFVVRPVLLPCFLALFFRWQARVRSRPKRRTLRGNHSPDA